MGDDNSGNAKGGWLKRLGEWLFGSRSSGLPPQPSGPPDAASYRSRGNPGTSPKLPSSARSEPLDVGYTLIPDTSWDGLGIDPPSALDANLCLIVALLEARDFEQVFRRTGIRVDKDGKMIKQRFPLFLELRPRTGIDVEFIPNLLQKLAADGVHLWIAPAYFDAGTNPKLTHITGQLLLGEPDSRDLAAFDDANTLREKLVKLIKTKEFARVSLPTPLQPCADESLRDVALPPDRKFNATTLDGGGVIVGVIDDGCALAHLDFLIPGTAKSRIKYLWDQARTNPASSWTIPSDANGKQDFPGYELTNKAINDAISYPGNMSGAVINEDKVYDHLKYSIDDLQSHGTHVMGIAAGNGQSAMGCEGVASAADIIFVQLPRQLIDEGGPLLEDSILDGVRYIVARAAMLGTSSGAAPCVINISYGGYSGPHDGTTPLASGIDEILNGQTDRAVVVSAGNGFEVDCHAMVQGLKPLATSKPLRWVLRAEDPTSNVLEVWYDGQAKLECRITLPGASTPLGPVGLGQHFRIARKSDGHIIGWISHVGTNTGFDLNYIRIFLMPTAGSRPPVKVAGSLQVPILPFPPTAPAPPGIWRVGFKNVGTANVTFHSWIERDDSGRPSKAPRQQSHFDPADADPGYTLAGLATGKSAICVGAYNTATQEVCRYSACGPTRDFRTQRKPDVCAPAEEDVAGHGVLCTSARRAQPTRMNGTSAAAPQVAGLVALMLQYNRAAGKPPIPADNIRDLLIAGAEAAQTQLPPPPRVLQYNRHQDADSTRPVKQQSVWADLIGAGKINVVETLKLL